VWHLGAWTVEGPKFAWVWDREHAGLSKVLYFWVIIESTMEGLEYFSDVVGGELGDGLQEQLCRCS